MTDLHEGRGPRRDRLATMFLGFAILLVSAGVFTDGLGGPSWLELSLRGLSIAAAFISAWRAAIQARRWKSRRSRTSADR